MRSVTVHTIIAILYWKWKMKYEPFFGFHMSIEQSSNTGWVLHGSSLHSALERGYIFEHNIGTRWSGGVVAHLRCSGKFGYYLWAIYC